MAETVLSAPSLETRPLDDLRILGALTMVDNTLELTRVREIFTADELANMLLDLRNTLSAPIAD